MKVDTRPEKVAGLLERLIGERPDESARRTIVEARATARALRALKPKAYEPYLLNAAPLYALGVVEVADGVDK